MSRALKFTEASVVRGIRALKKEGLRVVGLCVTDGTLLTIDASEPHPLVRFIAAFDNPDANEDWSGEA